MQRLRFSMCFSTVPHAMQAGWTSRDSSPGRSSSFAPGRTTQTGHLQQGSMMMSTLDLKRLWGGQSCAGSYASWLGSLAAWPRIDCEFAANSSMPVLV